MTSPETRVGLRPIGDYLSCSHADIEWALSVQAIESASGNVKRLGEILVAREHLDQEDLLAALESQRTDRLRLCSLTADLNWEELVRLGKKTEEMELEPGQILFHEAQRGDSVYVVLAGRLLKSSSVEQSELPTGVVVPGDVLGEDEFYTDGTRRCSVYATEPSVLLKIRYELLPRGTREKPSSFALPPGGSPEEVAAGIARKACEVLDADRAYVFVRDLASGDLIGRSGEEPIRVKAGTDVAGWVALKRETVNLQEAYLDPRFDTSIDVVTGYWTRSLLAAPVFGSGGDVVGVVEVVNKRTGRFDADDEALLHAFAHQCSTSRFFEPFEASR